MSSRRVRANRDRDVDPLRPQRGLSRRRLDAVDREGDDAAADAAEVADRDARDRRQALAQPVCERRRRALGSRRSPSRARSRSPAPRPSFAATFDSQFSKRRASGPQLVPVGRRPLGRVQVEERRLELFEALRADVEEPAAAWSAQELARRGRERSRSRSRPRPRAAGRPTGRRRGGTGSRPRARPRPTSSAGLTRPPFVGTWVIEISRTRSSIASRAPPPRACPSRRPRSARPRLPSGGRPAGRRCSCSRTRPPR